MNLFDDANTPDYLRDSSSDDGDTEYAEALSNQTLYRPGSPQATQQVYAQAAAGSQGHASGIQAATTYQKEQDAIAKQRAQAAHAQAMATAKAQQQAQAGEAARAAEAVKQASQPRAPAGPVGRPAAGTVPFQPSTPAEVAAGLDIAYAPGIALVPEGRPTWHYAAGGLVVLGSLAATVWYFRR